MGLVTGLRGARRTRVMKTVLKMDGIHHSSDTRPTGTLPAHAALITAATRLNGAPSKGWYFAVMVRAAYARLEGVA